MAASRKCLTQLCLVHIIRNSMQFMPSKDIKPAAATLKRIHQSVSRE